MRSPYLPIILLTFAAGVTYLACFEGLQVGQHVDDASYVMLAKSLLSGQGYRQIAYPGAPPETKYPPLLPLLTTPCLWLAGGALWAARIPALLCALAAVPVLWLLLRRLAEGWTLWLLTAVVALHPMVVGYAGMAMTEAPSLLLTWAVLLLLLRGEDDERPLAYWLVIGLLLGLGLLLRTDMVALLAAGLLWLLWRRKWPAAAVTALGAILPVLPWWLYLRHVAAGSETYLHEVVVAWWDPSPLPLRLWHGLVIYLGDYLPQVVTLAFGEKVTGLAASHGLLPAVTALQWLSALLIVIGAVRLWRQVPALILLFVMVRLGMLLGFARVTRYLLPMLPFLVAFLAAGLGMWGQGFRCCPRLPRALPVLGVLLFLALARNVLQVMDPPRKHYPDLVAGGQLVRDHTPPGAVIACTWIAKSLWLYTEDRQVQELRQGANVLPSVAAMAPLVARSDFVLSVRTDEGPAPDLAKLPGVPPLAPVARSPDGRLVLWRVPKPASRPPTRRQSSP